MSGATTAQTTSTATTAHSRDPLRPSGSIPVISSIQFGHAAVTARTEALTIPSATSVQNRLGKRFIASPSLLSLAHRRQEWLGVIVGSRRAVWHRNLALQG